MTSTIDDTVDHAVRTILRDLLSKIEVSAQHVLIGADPEDIHDLRVATRRTRTVLGQVPGVFPKATIKPFRQGFRRIGDITGKCRDLDVWLDAIDEDRGSSGPNDTIPLDSLEHLVCRHRNEARAQVATDLRTSWFPALLSQWKSLLQTPSETEFSPAASKPVVPVAAARILKAYRRLLKHGNALPEKPLVAQFHRLRIDGKILRYLLEFFGGLFGADRSNDLIENLKRLQDALGGINDREVQFKALATLKPPEADLDPAVVLVVERHRRYLQRSLRVFRSTFTDEFRAFADPDVTRSFHHLFGP